MSSKDTIGRTFVVAGGLCIVCSILVSALAVSLRPIQTRNKNLDRKKNILLAAGLYKSEDTIDSVFAEKIKARIVDFENGEYLEDIDAKTYNIKEAAKNPATSVTIANDKDIAGIKRRAKYSVVYEVYDSSDALAKVVIPVYGKGLWSTLWGFLAVSDDGNTIKGLGFYEHAETPGLGGEVDNPQWKAQWKNKKIFSEDDEIKVEVVKGQVNQSSPDAIHQVDGLSGATITARGVSHLIRYWVSKEGFGSYLAKLRQGGLDNG